jgi:hypothetical protein
LTIVQIPENPGAFAVYKFYMEAKDIVEIYPELFRVDDRSLNVSKYGLGVGKGWYPLLADLVREIRELDEARGAASLLVQVKEKFGGLRFYLEDTSAEILQAVFRAERLSLCTCEECGAPGKMYSDGWMSTLCREHAMDKWTNRPSHKADLAWERCWWHDVNNLEGDRGN